MRMFIVNIGYERFAVSGEDALMLMQIAGRAKKVEGYSSPFHASNDDGKFITAAELGEVIDAPVVTANDTDSAQEPFIIF